MHGSAITFAEQLINSDQEYDLVIASDMMDVAVFKSLVYSAGIRIPIACYFHENQLTYPISPRDTDISAARDLHYGFINYTSALVCDRVLFNSQFHRDSFLKSVPVLLNSFPDHQNTGTIERIKAKSQVLPLGLDLKALDDFNGKRYLPKERPLLLWNHRWEYDKGPDVFLRIISNLYEDGLGFDLALLGERGGGDTREIAEIREKLGSQILQDGSVDDFADYAAWLWRADILPVTSFHDFFGGSVVEAIYCGCHPLLPNRLSYPEHIKDSWSFYETEEQATEKLKDLILSRNWTEPYAKSEDMLRYDWSRLISSYDEVFSTIAAEY